MTTTVPRGTGAGGEGVVPTATNAGASGSGPAGPSTPPGRRHRLRRRHVPPAAAALLGIAAAAIVAIVVLLLFGRPGVQVGRSPSALAAVETSGLSSHVTFLQVTSDGHVVAVTRRDGGLWPAAHLGQGVPVEVRVTVAAPSWLRWLVGGPVSSTVDLRTPQPRPTEAASVTTPGRQLPVRFTSPVMAVAYMVSGGSEHTLTLAHPTSTVDLPVPAQGAAGTILVAATGRTWETAPALPTTVSWFIPPSTHEPAALVSPAPNGTAPTGASPITLTFSEPVQHVLGDRTPVVSPHVAGRWTQPNAYTDVFTPSGFGFGPGAQVTVSLDRAVSLVGVGGTPSSTSSFQFATAPGSLLRVQQILAHLGYLPVTFTPSGAQPTTMAAEEATVYQPLAGSFTWRWSGQPTTLTDQWSPGQATPLTKGALMTFEAAQNTYDDAVENDTVQQMLTPSVWMALLHADLADQRDPYPFAYIYVTKTLPETLTLWVNGQVTLTSLANTGIPGEATTDGTFPIYLRYTSQIMRGTNPDGTPYADYVQWVNYFDGSEAVHGFVRASYGFPQSLGCVELPPATAGRIFPDLMVGDLVTVAN